MGVMNAICQTTTARKKVSLSRAHNTLAQTCNNYFCPCLHDSLIQDQTVLSVCGGDTRKRLLCETKLTW